MSTKSQVLLHLTDLHFGCDTSANQVAARALALRGLVAVVKELERDWTPTVISISGDLGWKGQRSDYVSAGEWLTKLLAALKLSSDRVSLCPGNHDIDRSISRRYARPKNGIEADRILAVPVTAIYEEAFGEFTSFAKSFGIPPYRFGDQESYLIGQRSIDGVSLCALNSAWFCQGDDDQNSLWIGRPHIDVLEHHGQLVAPAEMDHRMPTVLLMHHPKEWFHDEDIHARPGRPNTFDLIARRCHLLLTGHAHGESRRADRYAESAYHINGGATYAGADYQNGFTIIRVEEDRFVYRTFEYDPRSSDREWRQTIEASPLPFRKSPQPQAILTSGVGGQDLNGYRAASAATSQRVVDAKSRALRPWGALPKTLPLQVLLQTAGARPRFNPFGQLEPEKTIVSDPFLQATRTARRSFLLGDLGSGKSTIAAGFVADYQGATARSLAIYAPAKSIQTGPDPTVPWKTVTDFLDALSSYFNGEISPKGPAVKLEPLLESSVEIALIVDGLDEVQRSVAQSIVHHLASIVDHWPTTQVIATGRPVELAGVDYARWQVCVPESLTDGERLKFFVEEALADGTDAANAEILAASALDKLRASPDLHALASTPLFCRLLFRQLGRDSNDRSSTLGDLLFNLIRQRLAEWAKQDFKASSTPLFDSIYPEADSRATLLSQLALKLHSRATVKIEEARHHLESLMPTAATVSKPTLIDEALRSFENSGLVIVNAEFQFPLRPFEEFCCGYAHAVAARTDVRQLMPTDPKEWRIASFAATMARRLGLLDSVRDVILAYIRQLLQPTRNVPAAAYVVSESQDEVIATRYIDELKALGHRPLWFSFSSPDWKQSAQVIAESLALAGEVGFEWFFREYLDPRYPFVFAGSKLTDEVFEQWAAIRFGRLSSTQKVQLSSLVRLHMAAASHQVISIVPLLAILTPEAFSLNERLWFCARLMDKPEFRLVAEQQLQEAIRAGEKDLVRNVLIEAASSGYEYAPTAALLHLSVFEERPPVELVRGILRADRGRAARNGTEMGAQMLANLLGAEALQRFLRWFLFDPDTMLAAGAAIELYQLGERRLLLLGPALLRALHDGGYVQRAEEILVVLVANAGGDGARWIAYHISQHSTELHGAHSGWWRILFKVIHSVGAEAPQLLARCMGAIGEFLLARHPEVRQGFRELLIGPNAAAFRGAMHDRLGDADPAVRHGAAMVLVTSDPSTEARALEEVVRSKARQRYGWHEWERFCLSLKFGPPVVSHLESRLGAFTLESDVFALAILYRNGVELDDSQFERLIFGELRWVIGIDEPSEATQSRRSLGVLLKIAEGGPDPMVIPAANKLLERFGPDLTPEQHARLVALTLDTSNWRTPDFQIELLKMKQDAAYAELIKSTSLRLVSQGYQRPLLELLHQAESEPTIWETIVWNELCTGSIGHDAEKHGQSILDLVRDLPEQRNAVGWASRKFLFDPRLQQPQTQDAITWLALLAHEAGQLSQSETEQVIVRHSPISASAMVPLLARLGHVPTNLRPRHSVGMPGARSHIGQPPVVRPPLDTFMEFARPSDTLHPELCRSTEESFFSDPLTKEQIDLLVQQSKNGTLIAGSLAVAYGELPDPTWATAILGYRQARPIPQDQCHSRLVEIWRIALGLGQRDPEWRSRYITELNRTLSAESGNVSAVASELLASQGWLNSEQLSIALRQLTQDIFDDHRLSARLSDWLSGQVPDAIGLSLAGPIEQGLATLDGQPWDSDRSHPRDAGPYLLIPLLRWKLSGQTDDRSKRVFLRGLRMALMPERQMPNREARQQGIEDVYPLLAATPQSILYEVIRYGRSIDDLATRTLCSLFLLEFHEHANGA
jgi:predicted MPP superfamily phosphohydrolase